MIKSGMPSKDKTDKTQAASAAAAVPASLNLERRVKQQVWAKEHDYFAVTAPGLEEMCAGELRALGLTEVLPQPGGVAFRGRWEAMYLANLWLRTAGRVLLRLRDFRVHNWPDLPRQAMAVPWEVYLPAGASIRAQVTLSESNLKHSGRVAEEVAGAAIQRLASLGLDAPTLAEGAAGAEDQEERALTIMVRGAGRRASISLDTTGEHLHRRGYRLQPGQAPLREDLAAALLMFSGYGGAGALLDPLCGAGTLPIEAGLMARGLAPGLMRSFAVESWPCHRGPAFAHLRKKAAESALPSAPAPILGRDRSAPALAAARANAERAGLAEDLAFDKADFFAAPPPGAAPGLLVINPPYGKRLGSVRQAEEFAARLGRHLRGFYPGWRCGVVLYLPHWAEALGLANAATLVVPHGGLKVTLLAGDVPAK
jgi:putative N6-adenine-specific DNA methylase